MNQIFNTIQPSNYGLTLFRYMHWNAFEKLLQNQKIVVRNCPNYEDGDLLEGSVTSSFQKVMLNAENILHPEGIIIDKEDGIIQTPYQLRAFKLKDLEIHRQHSYISCWTSKKDEDIRMWKSYANPGVILQTTVGHLLENFYSFADDAEQTDSDFDRYEIQDGFIEYNREKIHIELTLQNYDEPEFSIFHLDGNEEYTYRHENEYRILVKDWVSIEKDQDKLSYYFDSTEFLIPNIKRELEIPFDLSVIQKITFSDSVYDIGKKHLVECGLEVPQCKSKIY